jgi:hypothetical protein
MSFGVINCSAGRSGKSSTHGSFRPTPRWRPSDLWQNALRIEELAMQRAHVRGSLEAQGRRTVKPRSDADGRHRGRAGTVGRMPKERRRYSDQRARLDAAAPPSTSAIIDSSDIRIVEQGYSQRGPMASTGVLLRNDTGKVDDATRRGERRLDSISVDIGVGPSPARWPGQDTRHGLVRLRPAAGFTGLGTPYN